MKITVDNSVLDHFWEEPPLGSWEFWAFRWPVKAKVGDPIFFYFNKQLIAKAVIALIEPPGKSECERTGKYNNRWKVFWTQESFEKVHTAKELREWLETFEYKDFHNGRVQYPTEPLQIGQLFITDYHGNDLSLCEFIKCRKKEVRYWTDEVRHIETLITNCNEKYGSPINGPFIIPNILKTKG